MLGSIRIDKTSPEPLYSQVAGGIVDSIKENSIRYGAKLPTERELSTQLGISRGTVKKAFSELEKQGVISIVWGSGAYVVHKNTEGDGLEGKLWEELYAELAEKNYSPQEAKDYLEIRRKKSYEPGKAYFALVDNCPEAVTGYEKQLAIRGVDAVCYMVEDVRRYPNRNAIFKEFDGIFAIGDAYSEVCSLLAPLHVSKIQAAVDKETTINFLKITQPDRVGMLGKSRAFRDIVNESLAGRGIRISDKDTIYERWCGIEEFNIFLEHKSYLIAPPLHSLNLRNEIYERIFEFIQDGGVILTVNYAIDKDSHGHLEEMANKKLYRLGE